MTLRDDLIKLELPPEEFWDEEKLKKRREIIENLELRIKKDHKLQKKLIELSNHIQKKEILKANKMISDIKYDIRKMTPEQIGELEQIVQAQPINTPKKTGFFKKVISYVLLGTVLAGPAYAQSIGSGAAVINKPGTQQSQNISSPGDGSAGILPNGQTASFPNSGAHGFLPDGTLVTRPGYIHPYALGEEEQRIKQQQKPTFNYKTAKQYIDEANKAYNEPNYQRMIDLSEEALTKINQGKLKANSEEIKKIEHRKDIGYSYIKK